MGNQALARWPALKHMWANEKAVRALHVQFVPNRLLVDKKGNIVKWWNGENGKVVDGKFGKSINNKSSKHQQIEAKTIRSLKRIPSIKDQVRIESGGNT